MKRLSVYLEEGINQMVNFSAISFNKLNQELCGDRIKLALVKLLS
jgi:hypothetical protein